MQIAEVITLLERWYPPSLAESWDNTGFLLGQRDRVASRIMTCLTLTPDVAAEAIKQRVDLIVSHHPILFGGVNRLTSDRPDSSALLSLVQAGISVYSPHTSFDSAAEGINAWLIAKLGVKNAIPLTPSEDDPAIGAGRIGQLGQPVLLSELADKLIVMTGSEGTHVVGDPVHEVSVVAVACGAAGSMLGDATKAGADVFITGEMRFHDCLTARSTGVSLLLPGHYATERPAVEAMAGRLDYELDDVESFASRVEADPMRWRAAPQQATSLTE